MRASGILMHISSLPGPGGIGTMGAEAYSFVDFLHAAGQSYWQILPLSPTGYGDSPYQSFSAFAGNHYFIDLETLICQGLLKREDVDSVIWEQEPDKVNFGILYKNRTKVLYRAYERFIQTPNLDFQNFIHDNRCWLEDYGLYMALKEKYPGTDWQDWESGLRLRKPGTLKKYQEDLKYQINFQYFLQFQFFLQWKKLRAYAKKKGIAIIGDVPIYVPMDSADVWAHPELFLLNKDRNPSMVAGVPPDGFSEDGQLWGNPLYNWKVLKETKYHWWISRMGQAAQMYDVVRLDHFRGFDSYWAIPAGEKTAKNGTWEKGPGIDFISAIQEAYPKLRCIAEDLGCLTDSVRKLQQDSGYPGMKVLEFAFNPSEYSTYLPHNCIPHSVCYTGTHDNMTLGQWIQEENPDTIKYARQYMGLNPREGDIWGVIRTGMASQSDLFMAQIQDYMELDGTGRMNFPGTLSDCNWTWRAKKEKLTPELAKKIREMTKCFQRLNAVQNIETQIMERVSAEPVSKEESCL